MANLLRLTPLSVGKKKRAPLPKMYKANKKAKLLLPKMGKGQMKPGSFQPTNPQY